MKKVISLIVILFSLSVSAQETKKNERSFHWLSNQNMIAACVGQFQPDITGLNNMLKYEGAKKQFDSGFRMVGITMAGQTNVGAKSSFDAAWAAGYMLPQTISIGTNDSLTYKMRGWHIMTSLFGKDVLPTNTVSLVLAPGIDWGMMKLNVNANGNSTLLKNAFIAPLGRAEMRFVFGPVAFGARGTWRYDITNDIWKNKSGPVVDLPTSRNTGWGLEFFVGWGKVNSD